ncbi:MAG: hypothetical protein L3J01_04290 [Thiomicrorhabdus sp.]|nr:hypothetical protein [Thiomicrorhabdus sp.]
MELMSDYSVSPSCCSSSVGRASWYGNSAENSALDSDYELGYASITKGSGGRFFFSQNQFGTGATSIVVNEVKKPKLSELLMTIKSSFDLTSEQMKGVLNVSSRKTYYNWLNDSSNEPRNESKQRIFLLSQIVKEWKGNGYPANKDILLVPVMKNKTLLQMLSNKSLNSEQILFAGSRLKMRSFDSSEGALF